MWNPWAGANLKYLMEIWQLKIKVSQINSNIKFVLNAMNKKNFKNLAKFLIAICVTINLQKIKKLIIVINVIYKMLYLKIKFNKIIFKTQLKIVFMIS